MKKSPALILVYTCLLLFSCAEPVISSASSSSLPEASSSLNSTSVSSSEGKDSSVTSSSVTSSSVTSSSVAASSSVSSSEVSSSVSSSLVTTYTVSFINYNQMPLYTATVKEGEEAIYKGETPTKDSDSTYSYAFSGWDKSLLNVHSSFTTTALYEKTTLSYTVSLTNLTPLKGSVEGEGTYKVGDSVTLKATANNTYAFKGWYIDEASVSTDTTYVFTMPSKNVTVEARFINAYSLTVLSADTSKGTVTGSGYYAEGQDVTAVANPIQPYGTVAWTDEEGTVLSNKLTYSFKMPAKALTIKATFSMGKGSILSRGTYPQTKVTDQTLLTALNGKVGTLPTSSDPASWTDYGYYYGVDDDNNSDTTGVPGQYSYMWYQDITLDSGGKYRAVYFDKYRPSSISALPTDVYSVQDTNGYNINTVYFFKFESIDWKILYFKDSDLLLWSDLVLDAQPFSNVLFNKTSTYEGKTVYANNYAASHIRSFTGDTMYNLAFSSEEKMKIKLTVCDNSGETRDTKGQENIFACGDTNDYLFPLSYSQTINDSYGFNTSYRALDEARKKKATDYALCQGANITWVGDTKSSNEADYWLRTPSEAVKSHALCSGANGLTGSEVIVNAVNTGVAPAMWYTL